MDLNMSSLWMYIGTLCSTLVSPESNTVLYNECNNTTSSCSCPACSRKCCCSQILCPKYSRFRNDCFKKWVRAVGVQPRDSPVLRSVVRPVVGLLAAPRCVIHRSEGQRPAGHLGSHLLPHQYFTPDTFSRWLALFNSTQMRRHLGKMLDPPCLLPCPG